MIAISNTPPAAAEAAMTMIEGPSSADPVDPEALEVGGAGAAEVDGETVEVDSADGCSAAVLLLLVVVVSVVVVVVVVDVVVTKKHEWFNEKAGGGSVPACAAGMRVTRLLS